MPRFYFHVGDCIDDTGVELPGWLAAKEHAERLALLFGRKPPLCTAPLRVTNEKAATVLAISFSLGGAIRRDQSIVVPFDICKDLA